MRGEPILLNCKLGPAKWHLERSKEQGFRLSKFFSFSRGAKFGEFRPTWRAQVVYQFAVGAWGWGEMV
jgi:hypothetical protein